MIIKIGDFGESKILKTKVSYTPQRGTTEFRAPEMLKRLGGEKYAGHTEKVDIWAFGMVIFELLSNPKLQLIAFRLQTCQNFFLNILSTALEIPYRQLLTNAVDITDHIERGNRLPFPDEVLQKCQQDAQFSKIYSLFLQCTLFQAGERPTCSQIVSMLQDLNN